MSPTGIGQPQACEGDRVEGESECRTDQPKYPRVLIVGQSFNRTSGGGITLTNHFADWPPDRIAVATTARDFPDFVSCQRYYHLGCDEITWVWPLSRFAVIRDPSGPVERATGDGEPSVEYPADGRRRISIRRCAGDAFRAVVKWLGVGEFLLVAEPSEGLRAWIEEFKPDVVYTQLASVGLIRLVDGIVGCTHLPLVVHIMDDWPTVLNANGVMGPFLNRRSHSEFRALLCHANRLIAISERMAEVYAERYGRDVQYSHNPIESAVWAEHAKSDWSAGTPFRFVYAGRVGRANAHSLRDVAEAVAELAASGRSVEFEIYTQDAGAPLAQALSHAGAAVRPAMPHSAVPALLAGADALVLPLDFDDEGFAFSHLSMPTKTAEYMASGAPVLVYAPPGGALAEYARSTGDWAVLVDSTEARSLRDALVMLMADPDLRASLGEHAKARARRDHDAAHVRDRFRGILADAAQGVPFRTADDVRVM